MLSPEDLSRVSRVLQLPAMATTSMLFCSHFSLLTSHYSLTPRLRAKMGVNGRNGLGFDLAGGNGAADLACTLQGMRRNVMDAVLVAWRAAREA